MMDRVSLDRSSFPALILQKGDAETSKITPITCSSIVIGRGREAMLIIRHKSVSRKECSIEKIGANWIVRSLGSGTTYLNKSPVHRDIPRILMCSDIIELPGDVEFVFKCSPDENGRCCKDFMPLSPVLCLDDTDDFGRPFTIRNTSDLNIARISFSSDKPSSDCSFYVEESKDILRERVDFLQNDMNNLKTDLEQIKNKQTELMEKLKTLKEKLNEKTVQGLASGSCKGEKGNEDFCCDTVRNVKSGLIELLKREFNCSICGEIFIEPTITNCNHAFCTHCLAEWKKMKRDCPICRTIVLEECKPLFFDEFISGFLKFVSEKMLTERLHLINERKAPPEQTPPAKRARCRGFCPLANRTPRT